MNKTPKNGVEKNAADDKLFAQGNSPLVKSFEPVPDSAHREIDPVIPRTEPVVPHVDIREAGAHTRHFMNEPKSTEPRRSEPKRAVTKAPEEDKSRMVDEGGFDPPAWDSRASAKPHGRSIEHRVRVLALRVLEKLECTIHGLVKRLSGPEADPSGGPSPTMRH